MLLRCNKKTWNVRNSYIYVATATKIRSQFEFLRSPDATFGGHIGRLLNLKFKFGCRMISNVTHYVKYIFQMLIASRKSRDFENSDYCFRQTVDMAGDDFMHHILECVPIYEKCHLYAMATTLASMEIGHGFSISSSAETIIFQHMIVIHFQLTRTITHSAMFFLGKLKQS